MPILYIIFTIGFIISFFYVEYISLQIAKERINDAIDACHDLKEAKKVLQSILTKWYYRVIL